MVKVVTKSLSTDFGGNLFPDQLADEINASSEIAPRCFVVINIGDTVCIKFDTNTNLLSSELSKLDDLISNHFPKPFQSQVVENINISENHVESTDYITVVTFNFPGTSVWSNISNIKIISLMEDGGQSYDIKIYDVTNKKTVCSKNLSKTEESIYDLGTLFNLPDNEAIFELQAKVNGETVAHIKNINIFHD
jgi:hypothetical protein